MPTQHAIPTGSVKEYQWKMGSKWTYHRIYRYISPVTVVSQLWLVSSWGLQEMEISA